MPRSRKPTPRPSPPNFSAGADAASVAVAGQGRTTGRFVVIFRHAAVADRSLVGDTLKRDAGITALASADDYADGAVSAADLATGDAIHFPRLGIAIVGPDDARIEALQTSAADADSAILAIEPEYIAYALGRLPADALAYLRGYKDATDHLYERLTRDDADGDDDDANDPLAVFADNDASTWGLQATRVTTSRYTGKGVKLAVLDTGFDLLHPDFQGRAITSQSFVQGQAVQDGHGHGTHCVGTSCGALRPTGTRRYGIASAAHIHVGKVLSDQGSGATSGIVAGIEWALGQGCQVISMSLGANVDRKLEQYEVPIRRALAAGGLVVAAAGNNARRAERNFGFVGAPANADAAMAVAALDAQLRIADFSARSSAVSGDGGKVNVAGPGVDVFSSWPMATRYHTISGTSMATPHVAGIAALWCQATGATGTTLWTNITQNAKALRLASRDVGSGLVQAPQ